jgi:ligand-binding sensor domain-containing protein/signal transduction histidine kinase
MITKRDIGGPLFLLIAVCVTTVASFAEQLPVKLYTAVDGLPRDAVTLVRQDSRGFIWLAAGDGLSRFDGYKFTNYTTDDGLPDRRVNDLLETRAGVYWIATDSGLSRFNPAGARKPRRGDAPTLQTGGSGSMLEPMFVVYNPTEKPIVFNALLEDKAGAIWCGTSEGLYRLDIATNGGAQFHSVKLGYQSGKVFNRNVTAILQDRQGVLWFGVGEALCRLLPDGRVEQYAQEHRVPSGTVTALFEDREGNIWAGKKVGLRGELLRLEAVTDPSRPIIAQIYGEKNGLEFGWVNSLLQARDGKLLAATTNGLYLISPSTDGSAPRLQRYDDKNGLCALVAWDLAEDRDGNLWVASDCGAQKVVRNGFTGYGAADGLGQPLINSIFENREGALFVITKLGRINQHGRFINKFDGTRFQSVKLNLPRSVSYPGWGWGQTVTQDHAGGWWVPGVGLIRFPKVKRIEDLARARPQLIRTMGGHYDRTESFRLYEDSRGDIWWALTGLHTSLLRWERATGAVHDHTAGTGVPPNTDFSAFREDRAGNLWIGTAEGGGLLRYRDGKFKRFTTSDGAPPGWIIWLYLDHAGRLWVASQLGGLLRIDDPAADTLRVVKYTTLDGLSSNNIRTITEDEWGRIYVGTGHGVDRLDVGTGSVKQFTVADGLPKGIIDLSCRDRQGALWFGSHFGLSRFVPEKQEARALPSVYITGLRVAGAAQHISELGEANLPTLDLAADQRQVSVDFVGLGVSLGEELRYQYRLEGAASDWSAPTTERTINFANLAPGAYRFTVRAVNADGDLSRAPATFSFHIRPPAWQRWWFLSLAVLVLTLMAYALYRYRVARLLALANMRTRIATDLHDDMGANLTKIAILSEVAMHQLGDGEAQPGSPLSSIARIARESVAAMSDIVWAINPQRDHLIDLVRRMRQHAEELFTLRDIELHFSALDVGRNLKLGVDVRRDLFLFFKEATNNAARHADCMRVEIELRAEGSWLSLQIIDDGVGFDTSIESEGQGLVSMRRRAQNLGGTLAVESQAAKGTKIKLRVPHAR